MESWLVEIGKAIVRLLLNPLLYWFILITILASISRIQQERKHFGRKVYPIFDELYGQRLRGILFGLLISIVMLLLGIGLHPLLLLGIVFFSILFSINRKFSWLSSAYTFGFTAIILLFYPYYESILPAFLQAEITHMDWVIFTTLMGVFLVIEGLMISSVSRDETFPELFTSARGKRAGQHRFKKITLIPLLMIWPVGTLTITSSWWPIIEWNDMSFGLIIFPVLIGFDFTIRSTIPTKISRRFSEYPILLGFLIIALSLMSYYIRVLSLISIFIAIIGREWLTYQLRSKDKNQPPIFSPLKSGLKVLAILPNTPAVDLGLMVGDTIKKVNGQEVSNPTEFYQALQINRAFCKLDVVDERGEVRFTQRPFYQGEHHELGVIFVEDHQDRIAE